MTKPHLTPWFPADVKPVHVGVYETVADAPNKMYQHWKGIRWGSYDSRKEWCYAFTFVRSSHQHVKWRGLAEKPG